MQQTMRSRSRARSPKCHGLGPWVSTIWCVHHPIAVAEIDVAIKKNGPCPYVAVLPVALNEILVAPYTSEATVKPANAAKTKPSTSAQVVSQTWLVFTLAKRDCTHPQAQTR